MRIAKSLRLQTGYLTIITVVLIVIVGFVAVSLAYVTFGSAFATINLQQSTAALYLAESGLEDATHELLSFNLTNRSSCSGLSLSTSPIGNGAYTVASTGPFYVSLPTTLNGALTATATTITVASTANYRSAGRIMIDREIMNYASVDATHFNGVTRGVDGTTAVAHATSTTVSQYQCQLTSTGGVPKLTYSSGEAGGKRSISQAVQLQEAWAVGNTPGSTLSFFRWNRPTERSWSNVAVSSAFALNGISMPSNTDGWAIGASNTFLRWNGTSWTTTITGLTNVVYNGIYCASRNSCHVVGNMPGTNTAIPTIADWNGTTWTNTTTNVGSRSGHQLAIHCGAANDCWSVGNRGASTATSYFYRWNGFSWSFFPLNGIAVAAQYPFNGVFCFNTSNCWAVGSNASFLRWNGTTWSSFATGLPSVAYNGVYCNSTTDCWAVGDTNSGRDMIARWNGTSWTRDASTPSQVTNLNAVACYNANDCWAVGNAISAEPSFVHYDGTSWTSVITTGLPNVAANAITLIGPTTQPNSTWSENFS